MLLSSLSRSAWRVDSFGRQRIVIALWNIALLTLLLILHHSFSAFWGIPPASLYVLLVGCILLRAAELIWFSRNDRVLTLRTEDTLAWASIGLNLMLAVVLASVVDREDSQYAAILAIPVVEAAFRFSLPYVVGVAVAADVITFYWVWRYFYSHPPYKLGEYFEAGTTSMIFAIVAFLVFVIVRQLRAREEDLGRTVHELESARERLVLEEKLAAVGRLSSAVAHEIRNPVAMIQSSLKAAKSGLPEERDEMLAIAASEAARLVKLSNDFLGYARPHRPKRLRYDLRDLLLYVADACRAHATSKQIDLQVEDSYPTDAEIDIGMMQQALMNLVINAIDASPCGGSVILAVTEADKAHVALEVTNSGGPIVDNVASQIFEPFFTTKQHGTGLGLATARSIARAHGGDLTLVSNTEQKVRFSLSLPAKPQGNQT